MSRIQYLWNNLPEAELLKVRLCDLELDIQRSPILRLIELLYAELTQKKLRFKPHVWISTSWFSPYGVPGFAIPFYLLHPRLARLEQKYIGEVEGGTDEWCMKLLRHETGHAIDNAFHLRKSKKRQALFGLSGTKYPTRYRATLGDKRFVQHLEHNYAQAHPDEDWAETFALWLNPSSNWQKQFQGWAALEKLQLVDELLTAIRGTAQRVQNKERLEDISTCTQTLEEYLLEKRQKYRLARNQKIQKLAAISKQMHNIDDQQGRRWILM